MAAAARDIEEKNAQGLSDYALGRKRVTADVLEKLARHGLDVQYVVTGQKANTVQLIPDGAANLVVKEETQAKLNLHEWCLLLNLRREVGQGRDLLWGPTLLKSLSSFTPSEPVPLVAQRVTQQAKNGRTKDALALYLLANQPSAPWFVWPEGPKLTKFYSLDTGTDTLPLVVPELLGVPSPALVLDDEEIRSIELSGYVMRDPEMNGPVQAKEGSSTYVNHAGRYFSRAFVDR